MERGAWVKLLFCAALVLSAAAAAQAAVYEVGPGKTYAEIEEVPLENLAAGDTVKIYYRLSPYKSKWVITAQGTEASPLKFEGVLGTGGELPVIDGNGAVTRTQLSYWSENRGLIKFGESSVPPDGTPKWVILENLEFANARQPYSFYDDTGTLTDYAKNASAIWIVKGENITVRNCVIRDSGNGFFTYSTNDNVTRNILLEGCYVYDNGADNSIYEHNSYCESLGIIYQYNHYGPLRSGCLGNNLKDRSGGMVVRYNWIESGNRQLDLVDPEDSSTIGNDPDYQKAYIYGNILVEDMQGNRQICHFGGDMAGEYRVHGYFYNNTVVSTRTDRNTLFRATNNGTLDMRNNIIYGQLDGSLFEITSDDSYGTVNMSHNWLKPGYTYGGGSVNDDGTSVTGSSPGFVNESGQDYHITESSPCRDAGTTLHPDCLPTYDVIYQYVKHGDYEGRPSDGTLDIGAFEYDSGAPPPDLEITTTSLPGGSVGVEYSQTLQAAGGLVPYSWAVISGSLPAGLSLGSSTGTISGTPTAEETANFTVQVTDSQDPADTDTQALSIEVAFENLIIETTWLPAGTLGVAYSETLQATGGETPYTWSIISGALPAGLSLGSASGTISGTPTTVETASFTVRCTDSQDPADTADQPLSIEVTEGGQTELTLQNGLDGYTGWEDTWISEDTPDTNWGSTERMHLQYTTQDRQLHKFGLSQIPSGATINSATFSFYVYEISSGTPTVNIYRVIKHWEEMEATYNDAETGVAWGTPGLQSGVDYDGTVIDTSAPVTTTGWVDLDIAALVQDWVDGTYANEGVMLRLSSNGHLKTNMSEYADVQGQRPKLYVTYTTGAAPLDITTTSLPDGEVDVAYSQTLAATGGVTPYSWAVVSGSLPAGLSLNSSTGEISGTPTTAETANFTVEVTDSDSPASTDQQALSITINAAPEPLDITTTSLPDGEVGVAYSQTLAATGGVTPYSWAVVSGSLPAGLSLTSSTGEISGTPTTAETANFTVQVTDSDSPASTDQQALAITVAPEDLVITTTSLPGGTVDVAYSQTLAATGGVTPYSWAVISGALPAGLSLTSSTGEISGTPTTAETANFTVQVTDSQGTPDTDTQALSIVVSEAGALEYAAGSSNGVSTSNSAAWQDKVTVNISEGGGDDWLIMGFADTMGDYWGGKVNVRIDVDGSTAAEMYRRQHYSGQWLPFTGATVINLSGGSHTLKLQYRQQNDAELDVSVRNARVVAIKKDTLEIASAASDTAQALSSSPTDITTLNWTPASAGDYLVIYTAEYQAGWTDTVNIEATHGAATVDDGSDETRGGDDWCTWMSAAVATCDTSQQTAKIVADSPDGGSIRRARIAAVRLTGSPLASYQFASADGESTTTSTTYQEKLSRTWDAGDASDWLLIGSARRGQDPTDYVYTRMQLDDTTTQAEHDRRLINNTHKVDFSCIDVRNISGSTTVDIDYKSGSSSSTASISYAKFVALPLEAAGGGPEPLDITTTSLPDGQVGVAYSQTLAATGGVAPYSWAVVSGSLPAGLSLNSSTGEISGTPTTAETANFTVEVTDSDTPASTDQQALSITIDPAVLDITTTSLPGGQVGVAYSQTRPTSPWR